MGKTTFLNKKKYPKYIWKQACPRKVQRSSGIICVSLRDGPVWDTRCKTFLENVTVVQLSPDNVGFYFMDKAPNYYGLTLATF